MKHFKWLFLGGASLFFLFSCSESNQDDKDITQALKVSAEKRAAYLEKGDQIARESFMALSTKLKAAITDGGIDHAIKTCNMHASPIADSLAAEFGASIKRTAIRIRNEGNDPNLEEEHVIKLYQKAMNNGQELKPVVMLHDSNWVAYYSPIIIKPLCLNCHGEPGVTMEESTYQTILDLYPTDRAIGYKLGELRGIWSIKFKGN